MGKQLDLPKSELETVVYGGGETGCETAEYLAERGYKTVLISRSPAKSLARSAEMIYRGVLLQRLNHNPLIRIIDNTQIVQINTDGSLQLCTNAGETSQLAASRILIAQGRNPSVGLKAELEANSILYACIGDARKGGRIGDAVSDAYRVIQGLCLSATETQPLAC
jgi:pyruvate/2-oxoglutarate dehydrogenase complex dihydrolipoamide dehydrogenase (E3) component